MTAPTVTRSVDIEASPDAVYALVTDLGTLAELAEEPTSMRWTKGGSATPGAVFRGSNANGWRRWTTRCTVTDAVPGRQFGFEVHHPYPPVPVARWQYEIEATGSGCRVTESTWDRRPAWFRLPAQLATGVSDRAAANAAHMEATLRRLKDRAEGR